VKAEISWEAIRPYIPSSHKSTPSTSSAESQIFMHHKIGRIRTVQINQIRYFLAMCAEGSFTHAARSCGVAQPTVTNGIRALERDLGGPLFCRKRQITLTALGEAVRPHLYRIIEEVDLARAAAALLAPSENPADLPVHAPTSMSW
jgi:DNA-binding transcriptional LysR family regulator